MKLAPRWLITTVSILPGVAVGAEEAVQAASWRFVELFWVFQHPRKDVGGSEPVVLKLDVNLAVKTSSVKNRFNPLDFGHWWKSESVGHSVVSDSLRPHGL